MCGLALSTSDELIVLKRLAVICDLQVIYADVLRPVAVHRRTEIRCQSVVLLECCADECLISISVYGTADVARVHLQLHRARIAIYHRGIRSIDDEWCLLHRKRRIADDIIACCRCIVERTKRICARIRIACLIAVRFNKLQRAACAINLYIFYRLSGSIIGLLVCRCIDSRHECLKHWCRLAFIYSSSLAVIITSSVHTRISPSSVCGSFHSG